MSLLVRVVFPLPLEQAFLYVVPPAQISRARPGARVLAPLGARNRKGFIVSLLAERPEAGLKIKEIIEVIDERPFWDESFLAFTEVLSREYHSSWGEMLQAALPPSLAARTRSVVTLTGAGRAALAEKKGLGRKERAVAALLEGKAKGLSPVTLRRKTGGRSVSATISGLEKKGLAAVRLTVPAASRASDARTRERALQLRLGFPSDPGGVPAPVAEALDRGAFGAFYLFGAGPALSAVYRALIRRVLMGGGRVLVLVPEVALTREFIRGLASGYGRSAAVFHGRMTEKQKEEAWRVVRSGKASIVAGTRSALFVDPGPLRLIVVDGEHEDAYAQSESPAYDARRGAWLRARADGGSVVFGSSRPTVEAFYEAGRRGSLVDLGSAPGPAVSFIEPETETRLLSRKLEARLRESLKRGEPAIVFLNRRGYAASVFCPLCGRPPRCRRCDIPVVYHKEEGSLVCHYCGASSPPACPDCGGRLILRRGPGIQALEEELKAAFPGLPVARVDSDAASGREERERVLKAFGKGRIPLLVGTRLLAHRLGPARARLVGILSPEILLGFSDYRAGQRTFQAVAGMMEFCDAEPGGEVVIQTPAPRHFSIEAAAAGDFRAFYEREIEFRRLMGYPPFASLAEVTLFGAETRALAAKSRALKTLLSHHEPELEVIGPAFAPVSRVRDVSRVQVILKARRRAAIDSALDECLPRIRLKKSVTFSYSPFGPD
jgi:primosomal protein N' (replication factor Y)